MTPQGLVRVAVAVVLVLAAGCGGDDMTLSEKASSQLEAQVAAIRAAASAGDRAGAEQEVARLRGTVTTLSASREISEARAEDILAAAARVEVQLGLLPAPPAPPAGDIGGDGGRGHDPAKADEDDDRDDGKSGKGKGAKSKGGD